MAIQTISNAKIWIGGFDFSGDLNGIALKYAADAKETTNFNSGGFKSRLPGLQSFDFQHEGRWSGGAGNVDDAIFNSAFGLGRTVLSLDPQGSGVEGDAAYAGQLTVASYAPGAKIGDVLEFSVSGQSDGDPLLRGTLVANKVSGASASGSVFNLGAVLAGQKVYASLHVIAPVSGAAPTLNVILQSAPLVGFASPTSRITFGQATAPGAQWGSAAGAITDAFWRVNWTIGGAGPSFPFVVVAGIR